MEYYTINTNVMNEIFNKITYVKFFEKMEKSEKIINELKNKASEIEIQFKETEEKIKKAEEKIKKTIEITENTKIDTLALLAIFVAIISIIYGNISVSKDSDIKNIIITNVSTVACISFIMGYIEIFIKNNKVIKKEYFISIAMIIIALALIVSAYYD